MRSVAGSEQGVNRLARDGSISFVGGAISALLHLAFVFVVTWGFSPAEAGVVFVAAALLNILIVVAAFGADTGVVRFVARDLSTSGPNSIGRTMRIAMIPTATVGLVVAIGLFLSADRVGRLLTSDHAAQLAEFTRAAALAVPFGACALVLLAGTRGFGTMVPTVVNERISRPAIQIVALIFAIWVGVSWSVLGALWASAFVITCLTSYLSLRRLDGHRLHSERRATYAEIRSFWSFSFPLALASIFRVGVLYLDVVLVGVLIDARAAAIYSVATRLLQMGFMVNNAIGQAVEPMFADQISTGRLDQARRSYRVSTGWNIAATWPWLFLVAVFAAPILEIFGGAFSEGSRTVAILTIGGLIAVASGPVDVLLVMSGRSGLSSFNSALALAGNVALNIVLIPRWGLDGAAIAWTASLLMSNLLPLVQVRKMLGLTPFGRGWKTAALASGIIFGGGGIAWRTSFGADLGSVVTFALLASAAYLAVLWVQRSRLDLSAFAALGRRPIESGLRAG